VIRIAYFSTAATTTMKRTILHLFLLTGGMFLSLQAVSQRIAFVNTKYILEQVPEYASAQKELDRLSQQWQEEIDERHQQIKRCVQCGSDPAHRGNEEKPPG
jgi:Skp family chaperone for outer membrane proteins